MLQVIRLDPVFRYGMVKHRPGEGVGVPISQESRLISRVLYSIFSKKTPIVFLKMQWPATTSDLPLRSFLRPSTTREKNP